MPHDDPRSRAEALGPFRRLLPLPELCRKVNRSPASVHRDIAKGLLPSPLKLGRSSRWIEEEVDEYIAAAIRRRDEGAAR